MRIYKLNPSLEKEGLLDTELLRTLKPHAAPVVVSTTDHTGALLATGGADGIVKVWDIRGGYATHTFHGHSGLVSALHFFELDPSTVERESKGKKRKKAALEPEPNDESLGYRLSSGGEDGKVRVWDLHKRSSVVLDSHVSVIRKLDFCREKNALVSASRDRTIVVWDSRTWKARITIPTLEEVETAGFLADGSCLYSGGESARLRIWSPTTGAELSKMQSPGTEAESIQDSIYFPDLPFILTVHADQTLNFHGTESLTGDVSSIEPLPILRTLCGTHGQIVDVAYVGLDKSLLALATNSEDIRIISLNKTQSSGSIISGGYFGSDVATLKGHDDIVICMDSDWSGHWIVTGAKDNTARLWRLDPAAGTFACHATLTGHAGSLGAVALPHAPPPAGSPARTRPLEHPPEFVLTGSQDKTIKRWDVPRPATEESEKGRQAPRAAWTRKAHEKDINALVVHPSSPLFASASQDRTVKVWAAADGTTVGLLRGHKRGVWTVAFSPPGTSLRGGSLPGSGSGGGAQSSSRGYVLTGSADRSVRLWSLADYACLATLEGHTNSVLKVVWLPPSSPLPRARTATEDDDGDVDMAGAGGGWDAGPDPRGPLAASAAADGLVKVWAVQHGECAATLDNHAERVWALAAAGPPPHPSSTSGRPPPPAAALVSGDAAGALTFWRDTTAESAAAARRAREALVEREQALAGMARAGDVRGAVALALALDRPARLLSLLRDLSSAPDGDGGGGGGGTAFSGSAAVDDAIAGLGDGQLLRLLACVRAWNSGARDAVVAQRVLRAVVAAHGVARLAGRGRRAAKPQQAETQDRDGEEGARRENAHPGVGELVEGLRAHSERHFERVSALWDESFLVDYLLREMDDLAG